MPSSREYNVCMAKLSYPQRIKFRIAEIEAQLERMDDLRRELDELRIAQRVMEGLASENGDDASPDSEDGHGERAQPKEYGETLRDAILATLAGWRMETAKLHEELLQRRPGLGRTTLSSTLSRMRKAGDIDRDEEGCWHLVEDEEPSEDEGASEEAPTESHHGKQVAPASSNSSEGVTSTDSAFPLARGVAQDVDLSPERRPADVDHISPSWDS